MGVAAMKAGLGRGMPVLAVLGLVTAAMAAGGGPAQAAPAVPARVSAPRGPWQAPAGIISTIAGGTGGPARASSVAVTACGVAFAGGELYVGADRTVRQVSQQTGSLTTPAGTGALLPLRDGNRATTASLFGACAVAVDHSGNLVIADSNDNRVRVVAAASGTFYGRAMTARRIYTLAGTGKAGFSGDGGPAAQAQLNRPSGVAADGNGNLLIADSNNDQVRVVAGSSGTYYGQAMTAGDIYSIAGDGTAGFAGDGGPATAAEVSFPTGLAVDGSGNLLIADYGNTRVRVVAAASGTFYGQAMTAGDIYTVAGDGSAGFAGDGGAATSAELAFPNGVAVDAHGNLLIADYGNNRIRAVAASSGTFYGRAMTAGDIYTVAGDGGRGFSGDGGPATKAELNMPLGVAVDNGGNLLIADGVNQRVRVVAAADGTAYGRTLRAGDIYTAAGNGTASFSGNARLATRAQFQNPEGLAADAHGNLLIADQTNNRVRVLATASGTFYGQAMTAGDTYTVAGDGAPGFAGDGGPATSAEFRSPSGVAVDAGGNLVIADTNNQRVRVVAAGNGTFYGQPMTAGDVYTVAGGGTHRPGNGGPATAARLSTPTGAAVDAAGNLLVADYGNNRLRVVAASNGTFYGQPMTAGDIYTIAGDGVRGFTGDGGPATSTELNDPSAMALDGNGNLVFTDEGNERVRVIAGSSGTYYGQAMTAGDIYTVAGNGKNGFAGDGGPATKAEFWAPAGLLADHGNLVIADTSNYRVRLVTG